jgi:hypothetical protein
VSHARLFRQAELLVEAQIRRAVEISNGDSSRALGALVEWANAGGRERRVEVLRAVRHRVGCPPTIDALVDQVIGELGEEAAMDAALELLNPRENPERRTAIDLEIAAAAADAIRAWVTAECLAWRGGLLG